MPDEPDEPPPVFFGSVWPVNDGPFFGRFAIMIRVVLTMVGGGGQWRRELEMPCPPRIHEHLVLDSGQVYIVGATVNYPLKGFISAAVVMQTDDIYARLPLDFRDKLAADGFEAVE